MPWPSTCCSWPGAVRTQRCHRAGSACGCWLGECLRRRRRHAADVVHLQGFRLEMERRRSGSDGRHRGHGRLHGAPFHHCRVHYSVGRRATRAGAMLLVLAGARRSPCRWLPVGSDAPRLGSHVGRRPRIEADTAERASWWCSRRRLARVHCASHRPGELPNFGRLLDQGASMHLTTLRPTQPAAVWAAAFTGKAPQRNGIRSAPPTRSVRPASHHLAARTCCFPTRWCTSACSTSTAQPRRPPRRRSCGRCSSRRDHGGRRRAAAHRPGRAPARLHGVGSSNECRSVRLALEGQDLATRPGSFERVPLPPTGQSRGPTGLSSAGCLPDPLLSGRPGPTARDAWFAALAERLEASMHRA